MTDEERRAEREKRRRARREERRSIKLSKYDDFLRIVDSDNLYNAFQKSKRGVSWKESVQRYEMNLLRNIFEAKKKLISGESIQHGFVEFDLKERGKTRHIKSIHISERIIQKCLCDQALVPILSNCLIHDNGASVKNKGVHFAVDRLITHLSRFYRKNGFSNTGYALTIDFTKFFDSIRHDILFELQDEYIHDARIKKLVHDFVIVFGNGRSLGLGSQVSQISAVFYPSKLDHFIKEQLRIKYYGRYMDDLYLIHHDRDYLVECLKQIKAFAKDKLDITINIKKTKIKPLSVGILFLKGRYILSESGRVIRKPTKESSLRMRRKLRKFKALMNAGKMNFEDLRIAYQSWRGGYMKRFDAYYTLKRVDDYYEELFIKNHD